MKQVLVGTILAFVVCCGALAQQSVIAGSTAIVPTLVRYSGTVLDATGRPLSGTVGLTFLLYKDEQGGAPLWLETQNVTADKNGHYTAVLGSTKSEGLPADLFASGEARWLAVQAQGQAEQPRVLLLSVPYALKAGDAQTLGGLPASAFLLAPAVNTSTSSPTSSSASATSSSVSPATSSNVTTSGGTVNAIPLFTTATNIQNSILTQTGTTTLNVGGKLNLPALGVATSTAGFNSRPLDFVGSAFNSGTKTSVAQTFQLQAEPAGNNTSSASGTLNLLYAAGTGTPAETGMKISNKGLITFASGQTFPGTGSGTVKNVASGAGLTGGPITASGTLSIATAGVTNTMLAHPSLTITPGTGLTGGGLVALGGSATLNLDTTKVPILGAASNTFTGKVSAGSLTGNGSGLTSVNAAELGGLAPAAYAQLSASPLFAGAYVAAAGDLIVDWFNASSGGLSQALWLGNKGDVGISSQRTSGGNQNGMDFYTGFTGQMSIASSGNVGMGTTQPYTKLHLSQYNPGVLGPSLTLMNSGGGAGAGASIDFDGYDPTSANPPTVRIQSLDDGKSSSSLTFQTKTPGAGTNPLVEQVRISDYGSLIVDSSGNNTGAIGAGSTASTSLVFGGPGSGEGIASSRSTLYNQYGLDFYTGWTSRFSIANNGYVSVGYGMTVAQGGSVSSALVVAGNASVTGCLVAGGSNIGGGCPSDSALKTNIQPFPSVLDKLVQLQPVHFNWRSTNPSRYPSSPDRQTGLIAQQVEKIFPEMVSIDKEGYRRVNYGELSYLMLQGIRELKSSNDHLSADLQVQKTKAEQAQTEITKLRRVSAGMNARLARLDRLSAAKDRQLAAMSHQVEQLTKVQQQMALTLARFSSSQDHHGRQQSAQARHSTKSVPTKDGELAQAQF